MRFSVIIPVYNASTTIEACVKSILNGKYTDFELILVDDGSTDNTLEICNALAITDRRIKVLQQQNSGAAEARNTGIKAAKGDYLCFSDSDDTVSEEFLFVINRYAEFYMPDLIWFNMRAINEKGDELFRTYHAYKSCELNQNDFLSCFFGMNLNIGSMCSKSYRRDFILQHMECLLDVNRVYGEDWDFNLRFGLHNPKIVLVPNVLYNYIKYSTQQTVSSKYFSSDIVTFCKSHKQLLEIARTHKLNVSIKDQNSLFIYNIISLLNKLYNSNLSREAKGWEFNKITDQEIYKRVLTSKVWDNRYMSKKQFLTTKLLQYRFFKLSKFILQH